jgi:hypothetical protein
MNTEMQDIVKSTTVPERPSFSSVFAGSGLKTRRNPVIGEEVVASHSLKTIKDMRKEARLLSRVLKTPGNHHGEYQSKEYREIEQRITRLGLALGAEAEKRAKFSMDVFKADIADIGNELTKAEQAHLRAVKEMEAAAETFRQAKRHSSAGDSSHPAGMRILYSRAKETEEEAYSAYLNLQQLKASEAKRVEAIRQHAAERLSQAYASVVADIRPVGGFIGEHEFSESEPLELLRSTVGKNYPSDWLQASASAGPLVVAETIFANRAKYSAHQFYPADPSTGHVVQESFAGLVEAESAVDLLDRMKDEGIKIHGHGTSFDNGDRNYRFVEFAKREPFDPDIDLQDENGIPLGTGWKFGHVPRTVPGGLHIPQEKVWYREPVNYGRSVSTIFLAPESFDLRKREATAYHEFAHRIEDVVRNGVIEHLEEAFLVRRTTYADGTREELTEMQPGDGTLSGTELGRKGTFMMHYIGKEYLNHRSREVLSIGAEALFAGSYGSFLGIDGLHPADIDHRGFVLGVFAVV